MEEVYDDQFLKAQKHIMLENGTFECQNIKQSYCLCNHPLSDHLTPLWPAEDFDICLSKEPCFCDRFLAKGTKVTTEKLGKLPKKEQEQIEDIIVKDGKIAQPNDQDRFLRQLSEAGLIN